MSEGIVRLSDVSLGKKVSFTLNALIINGKMTRDEWIRGYEEVITKITKNYQFWVGDYLNKGEADFGEEFSQVLDEFNEKTLRNWMLVCKKIPPARRRDLSFSHHAVVAPLDEARQEELLDMAVKKHISEKELRKLRDGEDGKVTIYTLEKFNDKFDKLLDEVEENVANADYYRFVSRASSRLAIEMGKLGAEFVEPTEQPAKEPDKESADWLTTHGFGKQPVEGG